VPAPGQRSAAGVQRGDPAAVLQRRHHLRQAGAPRRAGRPLRRQPTAAARSKTFLRGRHLAGLVPRRRQHRLADAAAVGLPRPRRPGRHLLVPARCPGTARRGRPQARRVTGRTPVTAIAATMQAFFTERLIAQRRASPHTIAAYRDTWRLLLRLPAPPPPASPPPDRPGVLAIPPNRSDRTVVTFLPGPETEALLAAPARATRTGRRDHAW